MVINAILYKLPTMKYLFIPIIILTSLSCTETQVEEVTKIYSMDDVGVTGIKMKGDFKTDFPESTNAKWGFLKGREIAVIRYPTIEYAKTFGKIAGEEQTEFIEVLEKNIAHGSKVEKTKCRGHKSNRYGFNNKLDLDSGYGLENTWIINKSELFENEIDIPPKKVCVVREPLYTDFIIHGNLVILGEPLMKDYGQGQVTESSEKTIKFLEETVVKLP